MILAEPINEKGKKSFVAHREALGEGGGGKEKTKFDRVY